jgi:hypothetical protein
VRPRSLCTTTQRKLNASENKRRIDRFLGRLTGLQCGGDVEVGAEGGSMLQSIFRDGVHWLQGRVVVVWLLGLQFDSTSDHLEPLDGFG